MVAGLAACGGGGGGSTPFNPAVIDITAANRDTVAHASAAGLLSSGSTGSIPLASASGTQERRQMLGLDAVPRGAWSSALLRLLLQPAHNPVASAGGREQALLVSGPVIEPCAVSGSIAVAFDDRDNNMVASAGDVLTVAFNQCHDSATDSVNGTATVTYLQASATPPLSVSARMVMSQLAAVSANHALTLNGAMRLDFAQTTATVQTLQLTADGAVTMAVSTHLPYIDTVTLQDGFTQHNVIDTAAPPPPGGTLAGRTTTTVHGQLSSQQAGGLVDLATRAAAPLITYGDDDYPSSGVLEVRGRNGLLQMTALSRDTVKLELDVDNNGSFESTQTVMWDWLL
jgi:hypothetical protein